MISADVRARIRRLFYAEHWKIGTIAAELGVHRDTVALAVEVERFTNIAFRPTATLLDPYKDFVRLTLEQHPRPSRHAAASDDPGARLRGLGLAPSRTALQLPTRRA